ncbi:MAG: 2-C-methyl-D-erythritol 4-phosphate cytidylyltransferase [Bacteroidales bacterium]|nr:2-C-methyl-D-erythritol 4-phosphate cytidylyltransferase [Candidatus Cacconaster merdequi]
MVRNRRYVIILAGGKGERMGSKIPKQFLEVAGKPILRWTMERFMEIGGLEMIVVLPALEQEYWKEYCLKSGFSARYVLATGGISRFHSVRNALKYVEDGAIVAIHDGVRPLVSHQFLERMFSLAQDAAAVIPVMPAVESLRELLDDGERSRPVDRSRYLTVQTPQVFHSEIIKKAYEKPFSPLFTDDASVAEADGCRISLAPGERFNLKITTPEDLQMASAIFSMI